MRIQTNVESLNAYRNLSSTNRQQSTHMERLSSGFRINRAADDAAGLAISEQMRGQIGGLDQATENAQDSTSLIQTAEGALNESHEILQRMRELAVQSANDTLTEGDRAEIQEEVDQLAQELDRISETTEFNTQELLDGEFDAVFHIGANEGQNIEVDIAEMDADSLGVSGDARAAEFVTDVNEDAIPDGGFGTDANMTLEVTDLDDDSELASTEFDFDGDETAEDMAETIDDDGDFAAEIVDGQLEITSDDAGNVEMEVNEIDDEVDDVLTGLSEGDTAEGTPEEEAGIEVATQQEADAAITTIDNAIESVSSERSELGAVQNRLDHTISNLEVASENLQAAESRIRDTDMAQEMTEFTTTQILEEAGTAMLAQANQAPQNVLQLLG